MMKSEWYSQSIMIQDIRFIFYVFIKLKFLFKIILDFHAVKNNTESSSVFPNGNTLWNYSTISQHIDIDMVKIQNISITTKIPLLTFYNHIHLSSTPYLTLATITLFSISKILSFQKYYVNVIIEFVMWRIGLFSLSIIP